MGMVWVPVDAGAAAGSGVGAGAGAAVPLAGCGLSSEEPEEHAASEAAARAVIRTRAFIAQLQKDELRGGGIIANNAPIN
jgi:hypothetical protein